MSARFAAGPPARGDALDRAFDGVTWRAAEIGRRVADGARRRLAGLRRRVELDLRARLSPGASAASGHALVRQMAVLDGARRHGRADVREMHETLRVALEAGAHARAHDLADALLGRLGELAPEARVRALELALETRLAYGEHEEARELAAAHRSLLAGSWRALSSLAAIGDAEVEARDVLPDGSLNAIGLARRVERGLLDGDGVLALFAQHRAAVLRQPDLHLLAFMAHRRADPARAAAALARFFRAFGLPPGSIGGPSGHFLADLRFASLPTAPSGPLVSVLVAAHRAAATIEYAVGSLLAQTYPDIEVLVGDDGSDDGTLDVLRRRWGGDRRVRLFASSRTQGPYNVRNALFARARGELVATHDADDVAHPMRIATQVRALRAGARASTVCFARVTPDGAFSFFRDQRAVRLCMVSLMAPRRVIEEVGPFRSAWVGADLERHERLRDRYGDAALHVVRKPLILALAIEGSATRRPGAESRADGFRSPARRAYAERVFEHLCAGPSGPDEAVTEMLRATGNLAAPSELTDAAPTEAPVARGEDRRGL